MACCSSPAPYSVFSTAKLGWAFETLSQIMPLLCSPLQTLPRQPQWKSSTGPRSWGDLTPMTTHTSSFAALLLTWFIPAPSLFLRHAIYSPTWGPLPQSVCLDTWCPPAHPVSCLSSQEAWLRSHLFNKACPGPLILKPVPSAHPPYLYCTVL